MAQKKEIIKKGKMEYLGQCEKRKAVVKAWKQDPSNFDKAAHAGCHFAKKLDSEMFIIPAVKYEVMVFDIVNDLDLDKYFLYNNDTIAVVYPNGKVYRLTLKNLDRKTKDYKGMFMLRSEEKPTKTLVKSLIRESKKDTGKGKTGDIMDTVWKKAMKDVKKIYDSNKKELSEKKIMDKLKKDYSSNEIADLKELVKK